MADVGNNIFLPLAAALARGLSPLVRLTRKVDLALSLLSVALAVPALHAFEVPEKALELETRLGLTSLAGSTELHGWSCPASVKVLDQILTIKQKHKSVDSTSDICCSIEMLDGNGRVVARGTMVVTPSFKHAVDLTCWSMIESCTVLGQWSLDELVHFCRVEWDATGLVIVGYHYKTEELGRLIDHSCVWGAYGNLHFEVSMENDERTALHAKAVAMPLALGGYVNLLENSGKAYTSGKTCMNWRFPRGNGSDGLGVEWPLGFWSHLPFLSSRNQGRGKGHEKDDVRVVGAWRLLLLFL